MSRIRTKDLAERLTDFLRDQAEMTLIPQNIYSRRMSAILESGDTPAKLLLEIINRADIDAMNLLKLERQVAAFVPEGYSEVVLESHREYVWPTKVVDHISDSPAPNKPYYVLNHETWLDAGQLRSEYIHLYNSFPKGDASPFAKLKVVDFDSFEEQDGYRVHDRWDQNENIGTVYYEHSTNKIRLRTKSSGWYMSWNARIAPLVISDYSCFEKYDSYIIRTPGYAESLIEYYAQLRLVPIGSKSHSLLLRDKVQHERDALSKVQVPSRTITMEWNI